MKAIARCCVSKPSNIYLQPSKNLSSTSTNKRQWRSTTSPILSVMDSCTSMLQLKQIQANMTITGLITQTFPVSRVLAFCSLSNYGDIRYAHLLFTQIEKPNTYMWNTMIRGYSTSSFPAIGFSIFVNMVEEKIVLDRRSFVFVLKVCEKFLRDVEGKFVNCKIWKMGFDSDTVVQNGLIHFYGVIGCLSSARKVFDEISLKDVFSWTSIIDAYSSCKHSNEALHLFKSMSLTGLEPNEVTMVSVLSACSQKGNLETGKAIHDFIKRKNMRFSNSLMNALADMYVKCGCIVTAREIFDNMKARDVFSWTIMVNGYAKSGELYNARQLFNEMPKRSIVSWNAMIAGYSQNNHPTEAIELFHKFIELGLIPIESTLVCVLSACGKLGSSELGQWIERYYIDRNLIKASVIVTNALIDMYAKCGIIEAAAKLFTSMPKRNSVSWNSMIAAYASHGYAKQALILFEEMEVSGTKPDVITFIGVLSACTHSGLVTEGRYYFQKMEKEFGISPKVEHYACLIDLLCRTGYLEEACDLIEKMPMEPNEAAWGAVLDACRVHGNVELARFSASKVLSMDPSDNGVYVSLANISARERKWDDMRMIRSLMRDNDVKKTPGFSLIEA